MNVHKFRNRDGLRYYTPGHALGTCYVHEEKKFVYLPMPKNASTTMKKIVTGLGFKFINDGFVAPEDCEILAIIRDPVERWVSGLNEYYRRYAAQGIDPWGNLVPIWEQFVDEVIREFHETGEPPAKDEHTVPQRHFVVPSLQPTIFIPMDSDFRRRVQEFFIEFFELTHTTMRVPHLNQSDLSMTEYVYSRLTADDVEQLYEFHVNVHQVYDFCVQQKSYVRREEVPNLLL